MKAKVIGTLAMTLVVLAVFLPVGLFGFKSAPDKKAGSYKAVVAWTTALQKRNFYDACIYYSQDILGQGRTLEFDTLGGVAKVKYSPVRLCALGIVAAEGQSLMFGSPVFDQIKVNPNPATPEHPYIHHPGYKPTVAEAAQAAAVERAFELGNISRASLNNYLAAFKKVHDGYDEKVSVPKNGYTYEVDYIGGTIYVSVQRDSEGNWKIVDVQ